MRMMLLLKRQCPGGADIERDETVRATDFHNTNQYLSAQNEIGRGDHQQISSAVHSTAQRTLHGCKEIYLV
jgi:hypothetical protein